MDSLGLTLVSRQPYRSEARAACCLALTREIGIMRDKQQTLGIWIALGAGLGVALGLAMNNLALWLAIGVGVGLAIGAGQSGLGRK
jgi:hypothetical protein